MAGKATPTVTTQAAATIPAGGTTADTATLGGGFAQTGTVTFRLYGPDDATCARAAISTWVVNVAGAGTASSQAVTLATGGTYRWAATYGGDANNNAVATACGDPKETVVVGPTVNPGLRCHWAPRSTRRYRVSRSPPI